MAVVCGTDFSSMGLAAGRVAAAFARAGHGPVHLVHAADSLFEPIEEGRPETDIIDRFRGPLEEQAENLRKQGAEVEPWLVYGPIDDRLEEIARETGAELIVVGALGSRPQTQWLLGSTAERLARHASFPVLIVRDSEPLVKWFKGDGDVRVLFAYEFSDSCQAAASWLSRQRQAFPCALTVLHVTSPEKLYGQVGGQGGAAQENPGGMVRSLVERDLGSVLDLEGMKDAQAVVALSMESPENDILQRVRGGGFDIVVVGTRQRSGLGRLWHGSVSQKIIHQVPANVISVPPNTSGKEVHPRAVQTVLVATDLSGSGNRAVAWAFGLVPDHGRVALIHLTDREPSKPEAALKTLIPADAAARGVTTEIHVVDETRVAEAAERIAAQIDADAICIAASQSHGFGSGGRSIVSRLVSIARRPVLVVPGNRH